MRAIRLLLRVLFRGCYGPPHSTVSCFSPTRCCSVCSPRRCPPPSPSITSRTRSGRRCCCSKTKWDTSSKTVLVCVYCILCVCVCVCGMKLILVLSVYPYVEVPSAFTKFEGGFKHISMGSSKSIWALSFTGEPFYWTGSQWIKPGEGKSNVCKSVKLIHTHAQRMDNNLRSSG